MIIPPDGASGIARSNRAPVDVASLFVRSDASVQDAVACIDRSGPISMALVIDDKGALLNTLTDGDVRRGLLAGIELSDSIAALIAVKSRTPHPLPITAPVGSDSQMLLQVMTGQRIRQIPLVTPDGKVIEIVTLSDFLQEPPCSLQAVVMAGGFGNRLRPLTEQTPKPMLPVGGRPLIEHIIQQLRHTGVKKVNIATHYQSEKIVDHFGTGEAFGVEISYVKEESPLGTIGALGMMERPQDPVLVINGDILTDIDFRAMHAFHQEHNAMMTVAVRRYTVQVPYGVVDCDGSQIKRVREKPELGFFVNAGIYLLEPDVYEYIPANQHLNMTDLIENLLKKAQAVVSFPVREYWLDIGQHADYDRAQADAENGNWRWTGAGA